MCFHQKASQQLQVGVELEINCRIQESTGAIAYQVDLPKADLIFRGMTEHVTASSRLFILSLIRLHSYTILFLHSFFHSFVCTFVFGAYFLLYSLYLLCYRNYRYELDSGCCFGEKITTITIYICVKWYDKS